MDTLNSLSRGGRIPRILTIIVFSSVAIVFIGLVVYMAREFDFYLKIAMLAFYGTATLILLVEAFRATVFGRAYFKSIVNHTVLRQTLPLTPLPPPIAPPTGERSLLSYLLLPRPADLAKSVFFVLGILTLLSVNPELAREQYFWQRALVLFFVLEIVVYQCRYQWNDLRGLGEDAASPAAVQRGRIPTTGRPLSLTVSIVLAAMALRLFVAFMACAFDFVSFSEHLVPMVIGVFGLGAIYEYLRNRERVSYIPTIAGPLTAARGATIFSVCVVVGLGYPLRAAIGYFMGGSAVNSDREVPWDWKWPKYWELDAPSFTALDFNAPLVLVLLLLFSVGIIFVSMTWCLEAGSFSSNFYLSGGKENIVVDRDIGKKPHLLAMFSHAEWETHVFGDPLPPPGLLVSFDGRTVQWMKYQSRPLAIWNVASISACLLGLGYVVSIWRANSFSVQYYSSVSLFFITALAILLLKTKSQKLRSTIWLVFVLSALAIVKSQNGSWPLVWNYGESLGLSLPAMVVRSSLSFCALVCPLLVYEFFRNSSYRDLAFPKIKIRKLVTSVMTSLVIFVVGSETASRM